VRLARQIERRQATREALIAAARDCFLDQGFEATSTDAILARAGVSKGALYHHFASKADLLAAVFESVSHEAVAKAKNASVSKSSARDALGVALKQWLRAVLEPEPRRIILDIGPAVLGLLRARRIEESITQAPLRQAITRAIDLGECQSPDVDLVAGLLSAAVSELALTAIDRNLAGQQLETLDTMVDLLINALLQPTAV
jgi:AcrR family transcriptional regulator